MLKHNRTGMAIFMTLNIYLSVSEAVLVGFSSVVAKEQWHPKDLIANNAYLLRNSSFDNTTASNGDEPSELAHLLMPIWAYQLAAGYLIFISVLGLLMNIVVVLVIVNDPQKMTPLNWMLLNLACSDGLIAGFGTPISAAAALQYDWPFSDELCVAYAMIMSTTGIGSITTLTALALWRCQLVVYCPANRNGAFSGVGGGSGKLGRVQAAVLLTLIWSYSLAVTCPPLFGWGRFDREAAHISCSVNWESKMANNRSFILYMFAFGLFVPLVVIVVSYFSILRVVKKRSRNSDAAEKRVTVMVACMVGAFLAAWTPYSILALFETFIGTNGEDNFLDDDVATISPAFATIPSLFAKSSAVLNPLIYGLLNTQFRSAWQKFTTRFLRPRPRRHRRRRNSKDLVLNISGISKPSKRKREVWQLLSCNVGSSLPSDVKSSASVHLSMKEIVSNESQLAYVMANAVTGQQVVNSAHQSGENQDPQKQRRRPKNPAKTSCSSSMSDPETFVTQEQTIQMKSFRNRRPLSVQQQPKPEEQPVPELKATTKLVVVIRMISESTSYSCNNGDHNVVTTTTLESEGGSVFSADATADDNDIAQK
ncbi:rhodopsin, deep-sea form-like [Daphnia pulicaria]|uniref:rhodopsin, deep-sea form-like n=1 Tax=Daphnia pulicaria TaxID=35523 RepID=UPI001EEB2604|nr:rhodopsin, deep-sea form-like [Daphnia pulicaria]